MDIEEIKNAKYFCLSFFINSEEIMKSKVFHNYKEFYEFINKGCVIGSQFTVKVNIDDKLIDYKEFKTFIKNENSKTTS